MSSAAVQRTVRIADAALQTFEAGSLAPTGIAIVAAHPAEAFAGDTAALLAGTAGTQVMCVQPRGLGGSSPSDRVSLEQMVDDIEALRLQLKRPPWVFWGMSGGGWLALLYAHRHPEGLAGMIIESACLCFRARLDDPACALSPRFPAWHAALERAGLLDLAGNAAGDAARTDAIGPDNTRWVAVEGVGETLRLVAGPALLCSPAPLSPEMRRALPAFWAFDARPWAHTLRTPALVLSGGADPVVPVAHVRNVHAAIPGSHWLVHESGGHVPSVLQPTAIVDTSRSFLAGLGNN